MAAVGVVATLIVGLAPNAARRWRQEDVDRGRGRGGYQQEGGEVGHQQEGGEAGKVNLVALTDQGEDNTIFICISRVLQRLFFCLEFHFVWFIASQNFCNSTQMLEFEMKKKQNMTLIKWRKNLKESRNTKDRS